MHKPTTFRLYWLRESGCDGGTLIQSSDLEPAIRDRVMELAAGEEREFTLRLPYFDRREWRQRDDVLRKLILEREGNAIRAVLDPAAETRDLAATLALTDPAWRAVPRERDPEYFSTWQRVSLALQRSLKAWIAKEYFREEARFEDRDAAYTMIVYQASRRFSGTPKTEFTYDLRDYPDCHTTLGSATKLIGRQLQDALSTIEARLQNSERSRFASRYSPA